jgi:hypothetical protein
MKSITRKLTLAALLLLCFAPASFAKKIEKDKNKCDDRRDRRCQQVPEGGSAAIYLLGAGITCLGAMVIRSRSQSLSQS